MSASDFLDGEIAKKHLPKAVPSYLGGPKREDTPCGTAWTTGICKEDTKQICYNETKIKCLPDGHQTLKPPAETEGPDCGKRRKQ